MDFEMSGDELMFFNNMPDMLPLYEKLRGALASRYPDMEIKVSKTQISFRNKYGFAMASLPWRRVSGRPERYLLVSFGLSYEKRSPRIAEAVEAYPNRWTHHVIVTEQGQIDAELLAWLAEAYDFSMMK